MSHPLLHAPKKQSSAVGDESIVLIDLHVMQSLDILVENEELWIGVEINSVYELFVESNKKK
jgi:hypothetical protein